MNTKTASKRNVDFESQFIQLTERFCDYLKKYGIKLNPYKDMSVPIFSSLPEERKRQIIFEIGETVAVYEEAEASGEKLMDSGKIFWRAMHRMKLTPASDVFDKIERGDVVATYNLEHVQIFRSLTYFDHVSATFEQISCLPWWEIHSYPEHIMNGLQDLPERLLSGQIPHTIPTGLPAFVVKEVAGEEKIVTEVEMKYYSPVKSQNEYLGLTTISSAKVISVREAV